MNKHDNLLTKGVDTIYPNKKAFENRLSTGKPLRVYIGVDPTGTRLHIGHSIGLSKLQEFADAGHEAILLFGTGTVLAGDPSQRSEVRKKITQEDINKNIASWKEQVSSILDFKNVQIRQNADWLLKLGLKDIIDIASHVSAAQLFKRDSFQERLDRGDTVWFHETLYPLLQGYDSVAMDIDLEIGGTDQMFNMLVGRELLSKMKGKEKFVMTVQMILGTDGKQMSKSTGNCVWLDDKPEDMYGKIMSIPDTQIKSYVELLTKLDFNELSKLQPIDQKKSLAHAVTTRFHDQNKADLAQDHFEGMFQKKIPQEYTEIFRSMTSLATVTYLDPSLSKSEAKRRISQGAFRHNDKKKVDPNEQIVYYEGDTVTLGKFISKKIKNIKD